MFLLLIFKKELLLKILFDINWCIHAGHSTGKSDVPVLVPAHDDHTAAETDVL